MRAIHDGLAHAIQWLRLPSAIVLYWVPKHLHKSGLYQFVQLVQLFPAFGNQVTDLIQHRGNPALFVQWGKGDFNF